MSTSSYEPGFSTPPHLSERVGVQPRGLEFGDGITQRVYEVQYGDYTFGINMGDVAQVPTEAVMLPSTPWLGIGGGAIENVLHDAIGGQLYDRYAEMIRASLEEAAHLPEGPAKSEARTRLANQLVVAGVMDENAASETATRLIGGSYMARLGGDQSTVFVIGADGSLTEKTFETPERTTIELEYGEAMPGVAGDLSDRGIGSVVIVNVTPTSGPGREHGMTSEHMTMFTHNAAQVAARMGARSLTVPAVGTGFAAAFGFGMSMEDSLRGFFAGAKQFADAGGAGDLRRLDFNIYALPSEDNAQQAAEFVRDARILELLGAQPE